MSLDTTQPTDVRRQFLAKLYKLERPAEQLDALAESMPPIPPWAQSAGVDDSVGGPMLYFELVCGHAIAYIGFEGTEDGQWQSMEPAEPRISVDDVDSFTLEQVRNLTADLSFLTNTVAAVSA